MDNIDLLLETLDSAPLASKEEATFGTWFSPVLRHFFQEGGSKAAAHFLDHHKKVAVKAWRQGKTALQFLESWSSEVN